MAECKVYFSDNLDSFKGHVYGSDGKHKEVQDPTIKKFRICWVC